jgi:hypothetical protein
MKRLIFGAAVIFAILISPLFVPGTGLAKQITHPITKYSASAGNAARWGNKQFSMQQVYPESVVKSESVKMSDSKVIQGSELSVKRMPGEILVKFHSEAVNRAGGPRRDPDVLAVLDAFPISDFRQVLPVPRGRLKSLFRLRLENDEDTFGLLNTLRQSRRVRYAEPVWLYTTTQTFPNDPSLALQWYLHNLGQSGGQADADIDALEAWDVVVGDPNVVIAMIDTGTDYHHARSGSQYLAQSGRNR